MKSKHLPLIIGLSLPIIFILIISLVVFTPNLSIRPQHNFLYTSADLYYGYNNELYLNSYKVENGQIELEAIPDTKLNALQREKAKEMPPLFLYDVKTNTSHQVSYDAARAYILDPGPSSPDGYTVAYQYGHNGIFELFGSSNEENGYFISKDNGRKKLNIQSDRYYSQGYFNLIGWVK